MTIDEAIEFSRYKATQHCDELQEYEYDAEEHNQIAEWLEELKFYKEKDPKFIHLTIQEFEDVYNKGRADKYNEITSEFMLLTEEQVQEIREDAIDECIDALDYCVTISECQGVLRELKNSK